MLQSEEYCCFQTASLLINFRYGVLNYTIIKIIQRPSVSYNVLLHEKSSSKSGCFLETDCSPDAI